MRRRTVAGLVASVSVAAVVVGASVIWPGLDAQETPDVDTAVWALQTGDGRRYARVNTSVGELDTVRGISNPDRVVQSGDAAYIFSDSLSKVTRIDESLPTDLDEEALRASASTPAGTTEVATAGDFVAYRTDAGVVFAGLLSAGEPARLDPFPSEDEDAPQYSADAIAVDDRGILFAYSRIHDPSGARELLRVARGDDAMDLRKKAIFWLGQRAGEEITRDLGDLAGSESEDEQVREQAVFALSQRRGEGVPALIQIARTNSDPRLRKRAIFWLSQSNDPRAVDLFETILKE